MRLSWVCEIDFSVREFVGFAANFCSFEALATLAPASGSALSDVDRFLALADT